MRLRSAFNAPPCLVRHVTVPYMLKKMPSNKDGRVLSHRRSSIKVSLSEKPIRSEDMNEKDDKARVYYQQPPQGWARSYPGGPEKPLVEFCTNDWKTAPDYRVNSDPNDLDFFEDYEDESYCEWVCSIFRSRKVRRWFVFSNLLVFSLLYMYLNIKPKVEENHMLEDSLLMRAQIAEGKLFGGLFGNNIRVSFPGMIHLKTLDKKYLPGEHGHKDTGRLVFVGDIHGCREELQALLREVHFDHKRDHLITTGDMIVKGPDSPGTVDLLREIGARCVRGNHEDRILLLAEGRDSKMLTQEDTNFQNSLEKTSNPLAKWPDENLSRELTTEQLEYLHACPVILKIGHLDAFESEVVVVHAGLVPGVPLEDQDPSSVMTMRTIDLHSHVPSPDGKEGPANDGNKKVPKDPWKTPGKKWPYNVFWTRLWGRWMEMLPGKGKKWDKRTTVIYGHDSKRGLQLNEWTKGLDSACVSGGKLTALVVDNGGRSQSIKQVKCKDYRPKKALKVSEALQEAYAALTQNGGVEEKV